MKQIPKGALSLAEIQDSTIACCFKDGEGEGKKLKMQVYSGKPIINHWYWGTLVIDLMGMSAKKPKYPILEDHITSKRIGFTEEMVVTDKFALQVNPEKTVLLDTPESIAFQEQSAKGFPFQASVRGNPIEIQRLGEKEVAMVNGYELKGPAYIWRKWELKEGSVTVFGADSKTQSSAFCEKEGVDIDVIGEIPEMLNNELNVKETKIKRVKREEKGMEFKDLNVTKLKEECPDLFKEIEDKASEKATEAAKEEFSKREKELSDENKNLGIEVGKMSTIVGVLQKKDEEREAEVASNALKLKAEKIWTSCLSESDIPKDLYEKVMPCVNKDNFMEDGTLDVEKFKLAIEEEIKDWVSKGIDKSSVKGFSSNKKETDDTEQGSSFSDADTEKTSDTLLGLAGHVSTK